MRSYKAARRAATGAPVEFDYEYEVEVQDRDARGQVTGSHVEERTEHFVCTGEVSSLLLSEMAYHADLNTMDPEALVLIRQFFAQAFGDEAEYQRFFRLHSRYGDDDLLMDIIAGLMEDFTGRPTAPPSDSQPTPSTTGDGSKVVTLPGGFRTAAPPVRVAQQSDLQEASSS